jgi:uncharacterized protein YbjT (DUF2867 family)
MFLVMGITGKVGGATAEHLLAHGKEVRVLVRNREKASTWANLGVELVDGDWNDSAAIERALKGVKGAFVMLPAVWAPVGERNAGQTYILICGRILEVHNHSSWLEVKLCDRNRGRCVMNV